jgi:hypothetical protein
MVSLEIDSRKPHMYIVVSKHQAQLVICPSSPIAFLSWNKTCIMSWISLNRGTNPQPVFFPGSVGWQNHQAGWKDEERLDPALRLWLRGRAQELQFIL